MILIISNSRNEPTTDAVVDWLISEGAPFIRLNTDDLIRKKEYNVFRIDVHNRRITVCNKGINVDDVNVVWYRRWFDYETLPIHSKNQNERQLKREVANESDTLMYYLCEVLKEKTWLSNPFIVRFHNKIHALDLARQNGLCIAETLVTSQKIELKNFIADVGAVITKPIADPSLYVDADGNGYKSYTETITMEMADQLPDTFYLSLFQRKIDAAFEIRVFYLDGKFYSTAIVGSKTTDIKLSVRIDKMTKMVKYQLPANIERRLHKTLVELNLNSASIDIIKDKAGEYYFIEANPVGQFSGYGSACNYHLEKLVADWLIKNDVKKHLNTVK